jgi:hypothetical protein
MGELHELRDEINRRILAEMRAHGFRARKSGIHTRDLDGDALCWVSVWGHVTRLSRPAGLVSLIPNVGVRIQTIEHLLCDLSGYPRHRYHLPTAMVASAIFTPFERIGESAPKINWWLIGTTEEADHQLPLIIRAVAVDGLGWAEKHRNLDALIEHLRSKPGDYRYQDRLPVALLLAGRRDEAIQVLDDVLARGRHRTDEAMGNYRRFATRFRLLT